ncbi:DUF1205 domain-containing protein (plasmid) [Streptomyces sp. NBC_00390]|uniref:glycosyltransferase n=1 Tax=Streptomyces sp. NBC_00390 TaxID=2975736 RepID=UPI002E22555C
MRVLFCTTPMLGHFNPMVPLAWAMRAAGHEVMVSTADGFTAQVCERGLPVMPLPAVDPREVMARDRQGRPVPYPSGSAGRVLRSGRGWARLGARLLADTLTVMSRWRPDLVVVDPVEYAGRLAAARLGLPWVEHGWGIWPNPRFAVGAEKELAPELEQLGLAGLPDPACRLDPCSPSLQRRGVAAAPMRYVPVTGPATLPGWLDDPRRRPLVCVTFGSVLPKLNADGVLGLTSRLMRTLVGLGVDVAVATDPAAAEPLHPLPAGVLAAGWLPLDHVLPQCAVLVHYGASGTTMTAMAAGVPQVVVTMPVADAPDNAERIAAAGLGICLPSSALDADAVADACHTLLRDGSWRSRAAEVAAEQLDRPYPYEVAEQLAAALG